MASSEPWICPMVISKAFLGVSRRKTSIFKAAVIESCKDFQTTILPWVLVHGFHYFTCNQTKFIGYSLQLNITEKREGDSQFIFIYYILYFSYNGQLQTYSSKYFCSRILYSRRKERRGKCQFIANMLPIDHNWQTATARRESTETEAEAIHPSKSWWKNNLSGQK